MNDRQLLPPNHPDAPKYWMYEKGGELARGVKVYLEGGELTARQLHLLQLYLYQWVNSPVWVPSGTLEALRLHVAAIHTRDDLSECIDAAVDLGNRSALRNRPECATRLRYSPKSSHVRSPVRSGLQSNW